MVISRLIWFFCVTRVSEWPGLNIKKIAIHISDNIDKNHENAVTVAIMNPFPFKSSDIEEKK